MNQLKAPGNAADLADGLGEDISLRINQSFLQKNKKYGPTGNFAD